MKHGRSVRFAEIRLSRLSSTVGVTATSGYADVGRVG
jgi:hypothetical protein